VVIYDSMWDGTGQMARAIGAGLAEAGVDHKIFHAAASDRNDVLVEVFRARTVLIGSSTINNGVLPSIAPLLHDVKGLKFKNKLGAAFGSYGWSGEAVKLIEAHLADCRIPLARPGLRCKWQPGASDLDACRAFGREVGAVTRQG
jgi:flavorubredoxin